MSFQHFLQERSLKSGLFSPSNDLQRPARRCSPATRYLNTVHAHRKPDIRCVTNATSNWSESWCKKTKLFSQRSPLYHTFSSVRVADSLWSIFHRCNGSMQSTLSLLDEILHHLPVVQTICCSINSTYVILCPGRTLEYLVDGAPWHMISLYCRRQWRDIYILSGHCIMVESILYGFNIRWKIRHACKATDIFRYTAFQRMQCDIIRHHTTS